MLLPAGTLEAFGLYLVRTSALVLSSPLFGSASGFTGYKVGLIATVAFVLYSASGVPLHASPGAVEFAVLCGREVLIGIFFGFILQSIVLAIRVAGYLIGHEMAFDMASVVDPATGISTPIITRFYEALFYLGLLAVDGHHWMLRALGRSFERAPVGAFDLGSGMVTLVKGQFAQMFAAGITFAAPVLVLLMMVSVLIGLLARVVPQMNVLEVGFTLRIMVALLAMLVFAPLVAPAMDSLYAQMMEGLDAGLEALEV